MKEKEDTGALKHIITELFSTQKLAVLSSFGNEQPYASLVAFAVTDGLRNIIFATNRATRKYANLLSEPNVALLIDSRSNTEKDFSYAVAVTALGRAEEVNSPERGPLLDIYLEKHPQLKAFVTSPSCALLKVSIGKYYVVNRFQNVRELHIQ